MEAMIQAAQNKPLALPAPGQTAHALAKTGLPPVAREGDIGFKAAVDQFKGRRLPEAQYDVPPFNDRVDAATLDAVTPETAARRRYDTEPFVESPPSGRPVKMMGANDKAVRREGVSDVPPVPAKDRHTQWTERAATVLEDPDIARYVGDAKRVKASIRDLPNTHHDVLAEAYRLMNDDYAKFKGAIDRKAVIPTSDNRITAQFETLNNARGTLGDLIGERAPSWKMGNELYAGDSRLREAFEFGRRMEGTEVGDLQKFARQATPDEKAAAAKGAVGELVDAIRDRVSDPNLGEFAKGTDLVGAFLGKQKITERFRTLFGDDSYQKLLGRLRAEAQFILTNKTAQGGSPTADKLTDLAGQINPEKVVETGIQAAAGRPLGAAVAAARSMGTGIRETLAGRGGNAAVSSARIGTTSGEEAIKNLLAMLEAKQAAQAVPRGTVTNPRGPVKVTGGQDAVTRLSALAVNRP
jgi:hypothetical protein